MWDLVKRFLLYPLARFGFEFLGDHLWIAAILVLLVAILIWRFCMPVLVGFYKLFGWQGYALVAASFVTLGAFGAGWRAHRDSVLDPADDQYHGDKPDRPDKPSIFQLPWGGDPPLPADYAPFGNPENTPKPPRKKPVTKKTTRKR